MTRHRRRTTPTSPSKAQLYDMDLERMHLELYRNEYLTPRLPPQHPENRAQR